MWIYDAVLPQENRQIILFFQYYSYHKRNIHLFWNDRCTNMTYIFVCTYCPGLIFACRSKVIVSITRVHLVYDQKSSSGGDLWQARSHEFFSIIDQFLYWICPHFYLQRNMPYIFCCTEKNLHLQYWCRNFKYTFILVHLS